VRDGGEDRELRHGRSLLGPGHDGHGVRTEHKRAQDKAGVTGDAKVSR